ncbi:MAG TPA: hypothetical protein PL077_03655 [Treponemataceae bacterium]|nr:hypothetical protein [Treponemataceae bacterium]
MMHTRQTNRKGKTQRPATSRNISAAAALLVAAAIIAASGCASNASKREINGWMLTETKEGAALVRYEKDRLRILGEISEEETEGRVFTVREVRWFSNWNDGWTEAVLFADGTARLVPSEKKGETAVFEGPVLLDEPYSAGIRYRDTVIVGAEATSAFNRRLDRIEAAVEFLSAREELRERAKSRKTFIRGAGSLLFPEVYGYPDGSRPGPKQADNRSKAEGISWDLAYSAEYIPAELAEIRNSGTLFRDWEETADLFYFIFIMRSDTK